MVYSKPGIVFFDFNTCKVCGTQEVKEIYLQRMNELSSKTNILEDNHCVLESINIGMCPGENLIMRGMNNEA